MYGNLKELHKENKALKSAFNGKNTVERLPVANLGTIENLILKLIVKKCMLIFVVSDFVIQM